MPTTWPRSSRRADSATRRELEDVLRARGTAVDDDHPRPPRLERAPVAAERDARGIPAWRREDLGRDRAVRVVAEPEGIRRGVEGVLEHPSRDRARRSGTTPSCAPV